MGSISQDVFKISIRKMSLKNTLLESLLHFSEANELNHIGEKSEGWQPAATFTNMVY